MNTFLTLLGEPFMQRALIGGLLIGTLCAIIGVFVTLRKESFISDAVAHASLSGVALAFLIGSSPFLLALIIAIIMAIGIVFLKKNTTLASDSVIGIFFSVLFAIGVILLYINPSYKPEIETYLFGSILAISWNDIFYALVIFIFSSVILLVFYKKITFITFDPEGAFIRGVKVQRFEYLISILTAITIIIAVKVAGIILVTALLVIPGASARSIARQFKDMIPFAVIHNLIAVTLGMIISTRLPPGPVIVVVSGLLFVLVLLAKKLLKF